MDETDTHHDVGDADAFSVTDLFTESGLLGSRLKLDPAPPQIVADGETSYTILEPLPLSTTNGVDHHEQDPDLGHAPGHCSNGVGMDSDHSDGQGHDHNHAHHAHGSSADGCGAGPVIAGTDTSALELHSLLQKVKYLEQQITTCLDCHPILYEVLNKCGTLEERVKALEIQSESAQQVAPEEEVNTSASTKGQQYYIEEGSQTYENDNEAEDNNDPIIRKSEPYSIPSMPMEQEESEEYDGSDHGGRDSEDNLDNTERYEGEDTDDTEEETMHDNQSVEESETIETKCDTKPIPHICKLCLPPKRTRLFSSAENLAKHYTAKHTYPVGVPDLPAVEVTPPPSKRGRGRPRKNQTQQPAASTTANANSSSSATSSHVMEKRSTATKTTECSTCGQRFPNNRTLRRHMLTHVMEEDGQDGLRCQFCNKQFNYETWLRKHQLKKHRSRIEGGLTSGNTPSSSLQSAQDNEETNSSGDGSINAGTETHDRDTDSLPKKRGRGRPPKSKADGGSKTVVILKANGEKRGRGRPPKSKSKMNGNGASASVTTHVHDTSSGSDTGSSPKRPRGRPTKLSDSSWPCSGCGRIFQYQSTLNCHKKACAMQRINVQTLPTPKTENCVQFQV